VYTNALLWYSPVHDSLCAAAAAVSNDLNLHTRQTIILHVSPIVVLTTATAAGAAVYLHGRCKRCDENYFETHSKSDNTPRDVSYSVGLILKRVRFLAAFRRFRFVFSKLVYINVNPSFLINLSVGIPRFCRRWLRQITLYTIQTFETRSSNINIIWFGHKRRCVK